MLYTDPDLETRLTILDIVPATEAEPRPQRRRYRSPVLLDLLAKCPEHLFSTDTEQLVSLH